MSDPTSDMASAIIAEQYERQALLIVARLRRAADLIEHRTQSLGPDMRSKRRGYVEHARDTIHVVQGLVGNIGLDSLVGWAVDADRAAREEAGS